MSFFIWELAQRKCQLQVALVALKSGTLAPKARKTLYHSQRHTRIPVSEILTPVVVFCVETDLAKFTLRLYNNKGHNLLRSSGNLRDDNQKQYQQSSQVTRESLVRLKARVHFLVLIHLVNGENPTKN